MSITIEQVLDLAKISPCIRRKYGAIIVSRDQILSMGSNVRVAGCCNDTDCLRDKIKTPHGTLTEAGAEIHAEQAALIILSVFRSDTSIYIAGLDKESNPLNGFDNAPCYVCARMIKFAGIKTVFLPVDQKWEEFDIDSIMKTWERSWEDLGINA